VSSPGFLETYQYDSFGRPATVTTTSAGTSLISRQTYHASTGQPDVLTYPGATPLRVRQEFDRGRLARVTDADSGVAYWQLGSVDSAGQATDETLGNGVRVQSVFDAVTGRLASRIAGLGGGSTHQNLGYAWDAAGNLTLREERNRGVREQFYYDARDRLDYVARAGSVVLDLGYDDAGNLAYKSDVGTYRYDAVRKQAAVTAGSNTYSYDANGAVVNASGTAISWLSYELPNQFAHPGGNSSSFQYGPDRNRFRQVASAGGVTTETLYAAGGLYERVTTGGVTQHRNYIVADGRRVAVQKREAGKTPVTVYLLEDQLGGVDGFVSESGSLLARTSYQPFGARRSGDWLSNAPTPAEWQQIQATTPRGHTDHEHLDNLGVVHMNGRVYDPVLGRFLSPDPLVQAPYDTQTLNRYAYVRNNPMRYVDPSGLCFNQHAPTDGIEQNCLEVILVEGSGLWSGDRPELWSPERWAPRTWPGVSGAFGSNPEGGQIADAPTAPAPLDEVVVTATRSDSILTTNIPLDLFAGAIYAAYWTATFEGWRYFDEAGLVAGLTLALIEPTPLGEAALLARIPSIATPFGPASQSSSAAALAARSQVSQGALLWRLGTMGRSAAGEAQFWSLETPFVKGFATRMGIPPSNVANANFIESAVLRAGSPFVTRVAPGVGRNIGGGIEVVVPEGGVMLRYFGTR
jgi:RHS repeat-associated protein